MKACSGLVIVVAVMERGVLWNVGCVRSGVVAAAAAIVVCDDDDVADVLLLDIVENGV